jgi:hypothetical protein
MVRTKSFPDHYVITNKIINKNSDKIFPEYDSNNTKRLSDEELEKLMLSLPEIKKVLNSY